jgi:hypothetical protein
MPAGNAANRLPRLQRLLNQTNLFLVTPSAPPFSAQNLLHSPHDLKVRLKVRSSEEPPNYTRRPSPERYLARQLVRKELRSR